MNKSELQRKIDVVKEANEEDKCVLDALHEEILSLEINIKKRERVLENLIAELCEAEEQERLQNDE